MPAQLPGTCNPPMLFESRKKQAVCTQVKQCPIKTTITIEEQAAVAFGVGLPVALQCAGGNGTGANQKQ